MTAQAPDVLILDGEALPLFTNPLEAHLEQCVGERPFVSRHTANWRGYVATWEIRDGALWLVRLRGWHISLRPRTPVAPTEELPGLDGPDVPLSQLFAGQAGAVKATWYSGTLRVPKGERLAGLHMGYLALYEREIHITVRCEAVTGMTEVDPAEHPSDWQFAAMLVARRMRDAALEGDGMVRCPHCAERFNPLDRARWDGYRHRCGGWILIVIRANEDGWATCPHCGQGFSVRDGSEWSGGRHRCGGYLGLG